MRPLLAAADHKKVISRASAWIDSLQQSVSQHAAQIKILVPVRTRILILPVILSDAPEQVQPRYLTQTGCGLSCREP